MTYSVRKTNVVKVWKTKFVSTGVPLGGARGAGNYQVSSEIQANFFIVGCRQIQFLKNPIRVPRDNKRLKNTALDVSFVYKMHSFCYHAVYC